MLRQQSRSVAVLIVAIVTLATTGESCGDACTSVDLISKIIAALSAPARTPLVVGSDGYLSLQVGDSVDLNAAEINIGDETAGQHSFEVSVDLQDENDDITENIIPPDTLAVMTLPKGDSAKVDMTVQFLQPGIYIVGALADAGKKICELLEDNNKATANISSAAPLGALRIRVLGTRNPSLYPGQYVRVLRAR